MKRTSWVSLVSVLTMLGLLAMSFTQSASAIVPVVQNVTVYNVGGNTHLNITVLHTPEIQSHYVDTIEVTFGSNTTDLTIGVQQLRPDDTFVITYDVGSVPGTPETTVRVHCIVNGWSTTNWTGTIPEFPLTILALSMLGLASLIVVFLRKGKMDISK